LEAVHLTVDRKQRKRAYRRELGKARVPKNTRLAMSPSGVH
jgi:hypothetical protein